MLIYDGNVCETSMGDLIKGPQDKTLKQALGNECRILAQGNNNGVISINTINFIEPSKGSTGKKLRT